MTQEDFQQMQQLAQGLPAFERIGVFSPWREGEYRLFPRLTSLPRWRWDLNKPGRQRFDLLVASNVFMMSPDPAHWFRHVFACCRYFLLVDVVRRKRDEHAEFGKDGDSVRYAIGPHVPRVTPAFDLNTLQDRLLGYHTYHGGANLYDPDPLHLIALFRGDLAEPVLRIDDYPTGIRPILDDLSPLHKILEQVEARGLPYHLGIVPALLTPEMLRFLRSLQHMIPCMHGYDHAYPRYAPLLKARNDPYNQRSVAVFDEFKGALYPAILERLRNGRALLEQALSQPVTAYIPPCNKANRRTGRALVEAGFLSYLSEKRIPGCPLPQVKSDFYGRSNAFDGSKKQAVVTLHTTWEWDVQREGNTQALNTLLDALAVRQATAQAEAHQLAALFQAMR